MMKGFTRENQMFSLCGLNCGLCPMFIGNTAADAEMEISHVRSRDAAWNTGHRNIVMNVNVIHVRNMSM